MSCSTTCTNTPPASGARLRGHAVIGANPAFYPPPVRRPPNLAGGGVLAEMGKHRAGSVHRTYALTRMPPRSAAPRWSAQCQSQKMRGRRGKGLGLHMTADFAPIDLRPKNPPQRAGARLRELKAASPPWQRPPRPKNLVDRPWASACATAPRETEGG